MKIGATAVTYNPDKDLFLLVKRSESKDNHPGIWEFPGGKIRDGEDPEKGVLRELKEETGFNGQIIRSGEPGAVHYDEASYIIHPFLVKVDSDQVELSEEHDESEWIELEHLHEYDIVDGLEDELRSLDLLDSPKEVAASVVRRKDGKILLMKRVNEIRLFPGKWDFPSGNVENESAAQAAVRELEEETGIDADVERSAESFTVETEYGSIKIYPFLFEVSNPVVRMNWKHDKFEWIDPRDLEDYDTVDGLKRDLEVLDVL